MNMATDSRDAFKKAFGEALRKAREAKGLTKANLAREMKISSPAISQWESGGTMPELSRFLYLANRYDVVLSNPPFKEYYQEKTGIDPAQHGVDVKSAIELEDVVDQELKELISETNIREAPKAKKFEEIGILARDVPIYGTAVGGEDADFQFNGQEVDRAIRPAGLANARDIFALYVSNDSMYPAWRENAIIYVTPHRAPVIGDDVVIELYPTRDGEPGKAFIKRLKARTATRYVVEQFNPPATREFAREEVKRIYRVIPLEEALGLS